MTRAAVYARVSSAKQRDAHTIESQLRVLPDFVRARGWTLTGAPYVDDGRSAMAGKLAARTGLAALLRDAAAGMFDVVVVVDLDRLTRSEDPGERGLITGPLYKANVRIAVASTGQVLDLASSEGDLMTVLGGFFAADWARKHRTRIMEGKLTAIARGKKPAGPTPFGFDYDRVTGVWSVNAAEAAVILEIFARVVGESAYAIADDLNARGLRGPRGGLWCAQSIYLITRRDAYRGTWVADKRRGLTIAIPRIMDDATWYAARDRSAAKERQLAALRRTRYVYLCEGLAVCAICGARIAIATGQTPRSRPTASRIPNRYVCPARRDPRRAARGERCTNSYRVAADVDARVWTAIEKLLRSGDLFDRIARRWKLEAGANTEAWRGDLAAAERRIERLARVEAGVLKRYRAEAISDAAFDTELAAIGRERAQAQLQAEAARAAQFAAGRRTTRAEAAQALVDALRAAVAATTPEERRELVQAIVPIGGIRLSADGIEVDVEVAEPAPATRVALVPASDSSCHDESSMRFRLVA